MARAPRLLSGPRELVRGAALRLPLRGLSCPGGSRSEPQEIEPPLHGAFRLTEPAPRGGSDGRGAAAAAPTGRTAGGRETSTTGYPNRPTSARQRPRERILAAILGLALAAVLAQAARRSTAIRNQISRRSR